MSSPWVSPADLDAIRKRHSHIEQDTLDTDHDDEGHDDEDH